MNVRPITDGDKEDILDTFPDADLSIIKGIYYFDGWSDYEECGGILIFQGIDDSIQIVRYGYCVMAENNESVFDPEDIWDYEAEQEIADMERAKSE